MADIPTLQDLINIRAEQRLNEDIKKIREVIFSQPIMVDHHDSDFPSIAIKVKKLDGTFEYKETKPYWFFNSSEPFCTAIKDYYLPIYKNREAQDFIKKVDELKTEVDNLLLNNQQYD